jgi:hypothetical protein
VSKAVEISGIIQPVDRHPHTESPVNSSNFLMVGRTVGSVQLPERTERSLEWLGISANLLSVRLSV